MYHFYLLLLLIFPLLFLSLFSPPSLPPIPLSLCLLSLSPLLHIINLASLLVMNSFYPLLFLSSTLCSLSLFFSSSVSSDLPHPFNTLREYSCKYIYLSSTPLTLLPLSHSSLPSLNLLYIKLFSPPLPSSLFLPLHFSSVNQLSICIIFL